MNCLEERFGLGELLVIMEWLEEKVTVLSDVRNLGVAYMRS